MAGVYAHLLRRGLSKLWRLSFARGAARSSNEPVPPVAGPKLRHVVALLVEPLLGNGRKQRRLGTSCALVPKSAQSRVNRREVAGSSPVARAFGDREASDSGAVHRGTFGWYVRR